MELERQGAAGPPLPADRLRAASAAERPQAFREVYGIVLQRALEGRGEDARLLRLGANDAIARFIRGNAGRGLEILEVGCGFGATAQQVAPGQREVVGVDAAPVAIEVARRLAAAHINLRFEVMDAGRLEFPEARFDMVYSTDLIEHLHPDDVPRHLAEACRVLRPGGRLLIKTPSELTGPHEGKDPGGQGFLHFQEYRYATLLPLLRLAGFRRPRSPAFSMRIASRLPGRSHWPAEANLFPEWIALLAPLRSVVSRRIARLLGVKQVIVIAEKA
jgi:SAM-dependent methyltransferase